MDESPGGEYYDFMSGDNQSSSKKQEGANDLFDFDYGFFADPLTQQTQMEIDSVNSEDFDRFFGGDSPTKDDGGGRLLRLQK